MTARSDGLYCRCLQRLLVSITLLDGEPLTWGDRVARRLSKIVYRILVDNSICSGSVLRPRDLTVVFIGYIRPVGLHRVDGLSFGPWVPNEVSPSSYTALNKTKEHLHFGNRYKLSPQQAVLSALDIQVKLEVDHVVMHRS